MQTKKQEAESWPARLDQAKPGFETCLAGSRRDWPGPGLAGVRAGRAGKAGAQRLVMMKFDFVSLALPLPGALLLTRLYCCDGRVFGQAEACRLCLYYYHNMPTCI